MDIWSIYTTILLVITPIDETWNINNPSPIPTKDYILCNWEKEDFYPVLVNHTWLLREYKEGDNAIKAFARKKYWEKRRKLLGF